MKESSEYNTIVDMIMIWIKVFTLETFIYEKEAAISEILFRIPYVKTGVLVKTLQWMSDGVHELMKQNIKLSGQSKILF
jgi:hypothetical protein